MNYFYFIFIYNIYSVIFLVSPELGSSALFSFDISFDEGSEEFDFSGVSSFSSSTSKILVFDATVVPGRGGYK